VTSRLRWRRRGAEFALADELAWQAPEKVEASREYSSVQAWFGSTLVDVLWHTIAHAGIETEWAEVPSSMSVAEIAAVQRVTGAGG
jgi:hypothetical protein